MSTTKESAHIQQATIRFAGDSGDGMQLTGMQFTRTTGEAGNDLMTFPDFPAEIRAPAGTVSGVSGFQVHFGSQTMFTPGDQVDVLIAMNPAAFKANLKDVKPGGSIIVNTDEFIDKNLKKVQYERSPLDDQDLNEKYNVIQAPITDLTRRALEGLPLGQSAQDRCKNFFALGMTYWIFHRETSSTLKWIENKFVSDPNLQEANRRALLAGFNFAETSELFGMRYEILPAEFEPGTYRNITGNSATAIGLVAGAKMAGLPLLLGSYPITPASDILHELSRYKNHGVKTFQAEDEIAAMCAVIGASFGGAVSVTTSSGPGIALKSEAMNLAVMTELPVVIVDVQRAGPSTGMPTKTEQADLLQVLYGRNGESPICVLAPGTPSDCYAMAVEAVRIALEYMTPVVFLSDGYVANGSEPWKLPDPDNMPRINHNLIETTVAASDTATGSNGNVAGDQPGPAEDSAPLYLPYKRNSETLARTWAVPGMAGYEHRIGGLEKDALTGHISYDPENHETMVHTRAEKIERIANSIPEMEVFGETSGDVLILGWGSTFGSIRQATQEMREAGLRVSHGHIRYINPLPTNLKALMQNFKQILIPELNMGQLAFYIQGKLLHPVISFPRVQGRPFRIQEIKDKVSEILYSNQN